ncbi:MAG: class I SAM-dependent methyltransferase [Uliginosibacterium sp.]|nr:class I SAM-dependent methyltransferase [Uliginosibacterium sp.]
MTSLPTANSPPISQVSWQDDGMLRSANWRSESGAPAPKRIVLADDATRADVAWRLACEGTALLWQGDFQNARLLLQAIARRCDRKPRKQGSTPLEDFNLHRQAQAHRARILAMLLVHIEAGHELTLKRAPDIAKACEEAYGATTEPYLCSLRELQGVIGAHEWRKKGVFIRSIDSPIFPHYGVFSPIRGEYLELIAATPLPENTEKAFDIGTGTGVIAALLARRGIPNIIATDLDERALACATENIRRLGLEKTVCVERADLFPEGTADLIVCNPPWIPARPSSPVEYAVYDPDSRMLLSFLNRLADHLNPRGEGWLILSDLAVHLGLRDRHAVTAAIEAAGLIVLDRSEAKPTHAKASDPDASLHQARLKERTSLWRLGVPGGS